MGLSIRHWLEPPESRGALSLWSNLTAFSFCRGTLMLAAASKSNLEKWAVPHASDTPLSVTYVFRLTGDTGEHTADVDELIGDRFDRFFLRLFHRPTVRKVKKVTCVDSKDNS